MSTVFDLKVPQLKAELRRHGLRVSGNKPELQRRLAEAEGLSGRGAPQPNEKSCQTCIENPSLADLGIFRETFDPEETDRFPAAVQEFFKLVWESRYVRYSHFGSYRGKLDPQYVFETEAGESYDIGLIQRATKLAHDCGRPDMNDRSERDWMDVLNDVFCHLIRNKDEARDTHHW